MSDNEKLCPKCDTECFRDDVDVGVGIIYGPWGCPGCGWSEDSEYDRSAGCSPAQQAHPDEYVDQYGSMHSLQRLRDKVKHFGLNPDVIDEVFKD